ncbi:MAG TPA: hypothetical protein VLH10_00850, partial [Yinghuangia sp.]|nr:hypothetical protein [Yinghuangia sp.]
IAVNLNRSDLGHPEIDGLLDEITTAVSDRDPHMLECLSHRLHGVCHSEHRGKSRWMFVRRARSGSQVRWVAAHLPVTHRASAEQGDQRRATRDRIASAAAAHDLDVEVEARTPDGHGVMDALVTGPDGVRVGWKIQYSPVSAGSVRRRSQTARRNDAIPSWVVNDPDSEVVDRAPWARVDDMPWREIANGRELVVRSGVRHLQMWCCTRRAVWPCPDGRGPCDAWHHDWLPPAQCLPAKPHMTIDELVVSTAYGRHVPLFVRARGRRRSGHHLWVDPRELAAWRDLTGSHDADTGDEDDGTEEITYTGEPIEFDCHAGESARPPGRSRAARDLAAPPAPRPAWMPDPPPEPGRARFRLSDAERRAAAVLLHCPGWEVGPCAGCGEPVHRYGRNAGQYCGTCRTHMAAARRLEPSLVRTRKLDAGGAAA